MRYRRVEELLPHANNARTHSAAQVEQLAASIREFGFTNPILVDARGQILAGHGRVLAAQAADLTNVPTIELRDLTTEQQRAYVLADNQLALNAGWDRELLTLELQALSATAFDVSLLGFSADELHQLLGSGDPTPGLTDPDAVPPTPEVATTMAGDLWLLGDHRLLCWDATIPDDVTRLFGR